MDALLTGAGGAGGVLLAWKLVAWLAQRDRSRVDQDLRDLWADVDVLKRDQAALRERVAALPERPEFQRLEEKLDEVATRILSALASIRRV